MEAMDWKKSEALSAQCMRKVYQKQCRSYFGIKQVIPCMGGAKERQYLLLRGIALLIALAAWRVIGSYPSLIQPSMNR